MSLRSTILALSILAVSGASQAADHTCAADAKEHALQLLLLHTDNDDRSEIDSQVKVLPSLKNPANAKQRFDVLEVMGYVYKGEYRMRMIYAQMPGSCLLMGQEILGLASL